MTSDPAVPCDNVSGNGYACDLCNLPVEVSGFELMTVTGLKRFCCEGCVGVYQMLHGDTLVSSDHGEMLGQ